METAEEKNIQAYESSRSVINRAKVIYGAHFYKLRSIVNKFDIEDLIGIGAPPDEYEMEVTMIITQLRKNMDQAQVLEVIYQTFRLQFMGKTYWRSREEFVEISKKVFTWLQKRKE